MAYGQNAPTCDALHHIWPPTPPRIPLLTLHSIKKKETKQQKKKKKKKKRSQTEITKNNISMLLLVTSYITCLMS